MLFVIDLEVDGRLGHRQRMRHRDELRRLLDGHDAGDTGHAQYIALFGGAFVDRLHDFRRDHDGAFGRSGTRRHRFFGDIDHNGISVFIEMIESHNSPLTLSVYLFYYIKLGHFEQSVIFF